LIQVKPTLFHAFNRRFKKLVIGCVVTHPTGCEQTKSELEKVFRQQQAENQNAFDGTIGKVGQELRKDLNTKAEEAVIRI
jgi:hypothetical protein